MSDRLQETMFLQMIKGMSANLDTLAQTKADCDFLRFLKKCRPENCKYCPTYEKYNACYSQLSLCTQLRVDQMANTRSSLRIYEYIEKKKKDRNGTIGLIIFLSSIFVVPFVLVKSGMSSGGVFCFSLLSMLLGPIIGGILVG